MGTVKKSSVYDRKFKTYKTEHESIEGDELSFDELIERFKSMKQKYLEHEFLYKRTVSVCTNHIWLTVNIKGMETDNEYNKRIERYEKSKITKAAVVEKKRQAILKKKIDEFKRLKKLLESEVDVNTL